MAYTPTPWVDGTTPVNAANLNKMEAGIDAADDAAAAAQAAATAAQATADAAIPKALVDAKGDLLVASGDNVLARLAGGADGQVLTRDAAQALGLKWAAPAAGGADLSFDGDWVAGTYQDGDVVVKDGIAYLCVGGPTAVAPDPAPWGAAALATPQMVLIQEQVLGAVAASVSFTGIPQTYRHLVLMGVLRGDTAANQVEVMVRCNGDTGANYQKNIISGYGAFGMGGAATDNNAFGSMGYAPAASQPAGNAGSFRCEFPYYATSAFWKGFVGQMAAINIADTSPANWNYGNKWKNTGAITRLDVVPAAGNWIAGCRIALYGVA